MPFLRFLSLSIVIVACGTADNPQAINGHWHSYAAAYDPHNGAFRTLDISDTITVSDRYDIGRPIRKNFPRRDKAGHWLLPVDDNSLRSFSHNVWDDALTIKDDSSNFHVYIKSDPKNCELHDRYVSSVIDIDLKLDTSSALYDELFYRPNIDPKIATYANMRCADIFVGNSSRSFSWSFDAERFHQLVEDYPDSVFIQSDDVLIELSHIPLIVSKTIDVMGEDANNLVIHADQGVTDDFIDKIIDKTPRQFNVYRATKTTSGHLGVVVLRQTN